MAEPAAYQILELSAGTGMLGLALRVALEAIGIRANVAGGCEWESCAAAAFLAGVELEEGRRVPVWDDVRNFFGPRDRGLERVDALCAGYPCQPFSSAGRRGGARDSRHLWPFIRRIVARCEPGIVFFENVDGHVTLGLGKVLRDLERLGYATAAGVFSAEEVGAPHLRKRLFVVGRLAESAGIGRGCEKPRRGSGRGTAAGWTGNELGDAAVSRRHGERKRPGSNERGGKCLSRDRCEELGDAELSGIFGESRVSNTDEERPRAGDGQHELADAGQQGFQGGLFGRSVDEEGREDARERSAPADGYPVFPPGRTCFERWARLVAGGLDPSLMPAIESGVSVVADGLASPADVLRLGGNGVVPLQAAWAFLQLFCCVLEAVEVSREKPAHRDVRGVVAKQLSLW